MKFKILSILSLIGTLSFANVGINTDTPSEDAILHLNSNSKGLLLPYSTNGRSLPSYNAPDKTMEGMIIYNKEAGAMEVYDGEKWNKQEVMAEELDERTKQSFAATKIDQREPIGCLLVTCPPVKVIFNNKGSVGQNPTSGTAAFDPSNMYDANTGIATVQEDGIYHVTAAVGMELPIGVSLGDSYFEVRIYVNDNGAQDEQHIASADGRFDTINLFGFSSAIVGKTLFLKKGDTVSVKLAPKFTVSINLGWISGDPAATYFQMRKMTL